MAKTLEDIARGMVLPGKGLLAADEGTSTIASRFDTIGVANTEANRRDYREMLFRTTDAMRKHVSGVILFEETLGQKAKDGTPLVDIIVKTGAIPGVKADEGAKDLSGFPGEKVTVGLDKLRERLAVYGKQGAQFCKWRSVIDVGRGGGLAMPSDYCVKANMHALARYASLCQEAGLVPIVEPEVLMDGDHDIGRCEAVTEAVLAQLYFDLAQARVRLEGTVLKPSMVLPGKLSKKKASVEEVAERTVAVLKRTVPAAVPGIAFLSGGQSEEEATAHLSAMNKIGDLPWALTFSYGRALQAAALKAWSGKAENTAAGQRAFAHRAHMNGLAALGKWERKLEKAA